ncbi:MAG: sigma-70 family RNA polymerase sigma factor [Clostridia bacterium]|nr:sigma-70 family RNA polymerase sigma factor [Clostridia bacterium]
MQTVKGPDRTPEEEITRMVNEHQLALLRLCFTYLHDKSLAQDAVQETFLKAYRNLQAFRHDANEKTWLSRIAINCCRDISRSSWFRHMDRSVTLDMLPEPAVQPSYEDNALTVEVMKLSKRLREVILLYYFENMTTPEIAETLQISQQAVSDRLVRARTKLRKALGKEFEGDE